MAKFTKINGEIKVTVYGASGRRARPYQLENGILVKRCTRAHVWRRQMALGIDLDVWNEHKDRVCTVRFALWDGRIFEVSRDDFELKGFSHGDCNFVPQLFIRMTDLTLLRDGMRSLFAESEKCTAGWNPAVAQQAKTSFGDPRRAT